MKITKQQLRKVIREELTKTLNEEYNAEMEMFFDTLMKQAEKFIERTGIDGEGIMDDLKACLLYTSPSPRDATLSRMPSSA